MSLIYLWIYLDICLGYILGYVLWIYLGTYLPSLINTSFLAILSCLLLLHYLTLQVHPNWDPPCKQIGRKAIKLSFNHCCFESFSGVALHCMEGYKTIFQSLLLCFQSFFPGLPCSAWTNLVAPITATASIYFATMQQTNKNGKKKQINAMADFYKNSDDVIQGPWVHCALRMWKLSTVLNTK